jgi:CRP-like cAMP-binding protein
MAMMAIGSLYGLGMELAAAQRAGTRLTPLTCLAGEALGERGKALDGWIYILSGTLVGTVPLDGEAFWPVCVHGANEWVGEELLVSKMPAKVKLVAAADTHCLVLSRSDFKQAMSSSRAFANSVINLMSCRSAARIDQMIAFRHQDLGRRALTLLALLVESRVFCLTEQFHKPIPSSIELPVTQHTLGRLCGVSRTVVSGYLQELQRRGMVEISYGRLHVLRVVGWLNHLRQVRSTARVPPERPFSDIAGQLAEADERSFAVPSAFGETEPMEIDG